MPFPLRFGVQRHEHIWKSKEDARKRRRNGQERKGQGLRGRLSFGKEQGALLLTAHGEGEDKETGKC